MARFSQEEGNYLGNVRGRGNRDRQTHRHASGQAEFPIAKAVVHEVAFGSPGPRRRHQNYSRHDVGD